MAEILESVLHDGVEVTHEYEWNFHVVAYPRKLGEKDLQRHTVVQGLRCRVLYDGAVGHRVAERYAYLYHVDTILFKVFYDFPGPVESRISGTEVYR